MDQNQELLLTDSLNNSPRNSIEMHTQQQEILLIDCDKIQLRTSDITIYLPNDITNVFNSTSYNNEAKPFLNFCFLKGQDSQSQQSQSSKKSVSKKQGQQNDKTNVFSSYDYKDLTKKLEIALERIKKKIESKAQLNCQNYIARKTLYSSRLVKRVNSPKEQRTKLSEFQGQLTERKKSHSMMKTCITQPDQKEVFTNIFQRRKNADKYQTDRIINQQVQKQNPSSLKTKRGQPCRTKKEFLASMANWQEKRAKRQRDLIEKEKQLSMAGVTFTPQINARSKELMKKKGQMLPIYERQIHHVKYESLHLAKKPAINKGKK